MLAKHEHAKHRKHYKPTAYDAKGYNNEKITLEGIWIAMPRRVYIQSLGHKIIVNSIGFPPIIFKGTGQSCFKKML